MLGTELSARVQRFLIVAAGGSRCCCSRRGASVRGERRRVDRPELSWFSPFAIDSPSLLTLGLLTGVFIYWGWESAVNLNEETEGSDTAPGLAAVALDGDPARDLRR